MIQFHQLPENWYLFSKSHLSDFSFIGPNRPTGGENKSFVVENSELKINIFMSNWFYKLISVVNLYSAPYFGLAVCVLTLDCYSVRGEVYF
jgi:hypothetical protein